MFNTEGSERVLSDNIEEPPLWCVSALSADSIAFETTKLEWASVWMVLVLGVDAVSSLS